MALMLIMDDFIASLEKEDIANTCVSWLSKDFDTVNHDILSSKLEHRGIRGSGLYWFRSYLTDRKQ